MSVLCHCWHPSLFTYFFSPSSYLRLLCYLQTSNPGSCVNAFSIPTLFIVWSFKTTCFSSLHQFVAVGPFPPLFVLLIWTGILPFFWDSSPKSLTCFCTSIVVLGETFLWSNFTRKLDVSRFHMIYPGRLLMHIATQITVSSLLCFHIYHSVQYNSIQLGFI